MIATIILISVMLPWSALSKMEELDCMHPQTKGDFTRLTDCTLNTTKRSGVFGYLSGICVSGNMSLTGRKNLTHIMAAPNMQRHFSVFHHAFTLTLKWLKLTGGKATNGGSIRVDSGNLVIYSSLLTLNVATQQGGAIYGGPYMVGSPTHTDPINIKCIK